MKNRHPALTHTQPMLACALAMLLAIFTAVTARAELLASDDFETLGGGAGWAAEWTVKSGVTVIADEPLTYLFDNGATIGGGGTLKVASANDNNALVRSLSAPITDGRDMYVSFIFKVKSTTIADGTSLDTRFCSWLAMDSNPSINNDTIGLVGNTGYLGARVMNLTTSATTLLKYGTTYFCIIKYTGWDGSTYRTCKVWLNPGSNSESSTATATTAVRTATEGGGSDSFLGLSIRSYGLSADIFHLVTALRVGDTWNDVLPGAVEDAFTVVAENENWIRLNHSLEIAPGGVFDFSGQDIVDAPAGKHGALKVSANGHFEFENRPGARARFWGVNLVQNANYLTREQADRVAERLARSGYNTIRIHHYDEYLVSSSLSKGQNSWDLDPARLDQLDYLFHALKQRGIYISIDLFSSRGFSAEEATAFGVSSTSIAKSNFKGLIPVSEAALESWKKFATNLLTHRNPYTGLTWAEDPALIGICPVNENQPHHGISHEEVRPCYEARFNERTPPPGETTAERQVAWNRFIFENSFVTNDAMAAHIRSLGTKALITAANTTKAAAMAILRSRYDYVDDHLYWDHPSFPVSDWALPINFSQTSATKTSAYLPGRLMPSRIFGKPFTTTEFHYCRPNRYRAEGALLMPAYASLQDWDALYNFDYAKDVPSAMDGTADNYFAIANDPVGLIGDRVGALLFQRGDITPATTTIAYTVREAEAYANDANNNPGREYDDSFRRIGLIARVGSLPGEPAAVLAANPGIAAAIVGPTPALSPLPANTYASASNITATLQNAGILPAGSISADSKTLTSETGQLQINIETGTFRIVTPRGEHFILAPGIQLAGDKVSVTNGSTFGALAVAALKTAADTEMPTLATARRILVTHLTDSLSTGMTFSYPDRKQLTAWGSLPHLVHRGEATLDITLSAGEWTAWDVDITGARIRSRTLTRVGAMDTWRLTVSTGGTTETGAQFAYELARSDFTPPALPIVTNVTPLEVDPGDTITITGENLENATVKIGGIVATVTANTTTSITVTVPQDAISGTITIATAIGAITATQQLTLTLPTNLHSGLAAYDEFDTYTAGSALHTLTGGEGWNDAGWNTNPAATVSSETVAYTFASGAIRGSGNSIKMEIGNIDPMISRRLKTAVTDGSDVYVSFVFKIKSSNTGEEDGASLPTTSHIFAAWQAIDPNPATTDTIGVIGFNGRAGARVNNASSPALVSNTLKFGETYFFVIKYTGWDSTAAAYRASQVWLNPAPADEASTNAAITATQTQTAGGSSAFEGLRVRAYTTVTGRHHLVDSLRVGSTWDAVVKQPAPEVTTISPLTVPPGGAITITGANLHDATVTIGGLPATVLERSATQIKMLVPMDAINGAITIANGGGAITPTQTLTITTDTPVIPGITNISPLAAHPGNSITITGENLAAATVTIGSIPAPIAASTATSLTVTIPEGTIGTNVPVTVTVGTNTVTATQTLTITAAPPSAPTVTGISATTAHPGQSITITGTNLADATVTIGVVAATIIANTATSITVTVPAGTAGGIITINTLGGTVNASQQITITPDSGDAAALAAPSGIVVTAGATPKIYVSDTTRHTVQIIESGTIRHFVGMTGITGTLNGSGTDARFNKPRGLTINRAGALIVADSGNNRIRSVTADGIVTDTGTSAAIDALHASPSGVAAFDGASGETYVADTANHIIKKITGTGEVRILAGSATSGTANGAFLAAQFNEPAGIAVDVSGSHLYIADTANHVIRLINLASGTVSTFAGQMAAPGNADGDPLATARFNLPADLIVDSSGDVYVADAGNSRIRVITSGSTRAVATLAGDAPGFLDGSGTLASFLHPSALAMAEDGSIYVADTGNAAIRRIAPAADTVTTLRLRVGPPIATGTLTPPPPPPEPWDQRRGSGGGGAPSLWFIAAAIALLLRRAAQ